MAAHSSSSSTLESDAALLAGVPTEILDLAFEYYDWGLDFLLANDFYDIAIDFCDLRSSKFSLFKPFLYAPVAGLGGSLLIFITLFL